MRGVNGAVRSCNSKYNSEFSTRSYEDVLGMLLYILLKSGNPSKMLSSKQTGAETLGSCIACGMINYLDIYRDLQNSKN